MPDAHEMTNYDLSYWVGKHVIGDPDDVAPAWDYAESLNASALAEEKIVEMGLVIPYEHNLQQVYFDKGGRLDYDHKSIVLATARQRCEAMWLIRDKIKEAKANV